MNYTQNHKIAQVTESTLVVGVDIEVSSTMPELLTGEDGADPESVSLLKQPGKLPTL